MKTSASKLSRRNFLLTLGAGGVATAGAVIGKHSQSQAKKTPAAASGKGYQLTAHVRKYYDTTKV